MSGSNYVEINNFGRLVQFGVCYGGTIIFLPGPSDAFHSYFNGNEEYEPRIQIRMTRFSDLITGNNLKRWLQQDNLLRLQVVHSTTQTLASQAKTARPIIGRISRVA